MLCNLWCSCTTCRSAPDYRSSVTCYRTRSFGATVLFPVIWLFYPVSGGVADAAATAQHPKIPTGNSLHPRDRLTHTHTHTMYSTMHVYIQHYLSVTVILEPFFSLKDLKRAAVCDHSVLCVCLLHWPFRNISSFFLSTFSHAGCGYRTNMSVRHTSHIFQHTHTHTLVLFYPKIESPASEGKLWRVKRKTKESRDMFLKLL